jgi:broad specificity phosphatase PhoE
MTIYLFRHARAGERRIWDGEDWLRPLSRRGQRQAEGLLAQLADAHIDRILSSPYVRCLESVVPLAGERKVAIEPVDALAEGATLDEAVALVRKHLHHDAVLCSHGDIIPMLLDYYASRGLDLSAQPAWPKGSIWALEVDSTGDVLAARYIAPPPG